MTDGWHFLGTLSAQKPKPFLEGVCSMTND
jgi:hypothetical protein